MERNAIDKQINTKKNEIANRYKMMCTCDNSGKKIAEPILTQCFVKSTKNKDNLTYKVGVPLFLKKSDDELKFLRHDKNVVKNNMESAINRYERSLENIRKNRIEEEPDIWIRNSLNENKKRQKEVLNTYKFLKLQINQKVILIFIIEIKRFRTKTGRKHAVESTLWYWRYRRNLEIKNR